MFVVVEYVGQLPRYCGEAVEGKIKHEIRDVTSKKHAGSVFLGIGGQNMKDLEMVPHPLINLRSQIRAS